MLANNILAKESTTDETRVHLMSRCWARECKYTKMRALDRERYLSRCNYS